LSGVVYLDRCPVKRRRDTDQQRAGGLFYVGAIILQQVCIVATRLFD
jgi:hypothetical protein